MDRVFVQAKWIAELPSLVVSIFKRSVSDHYPLLLQSYNVDWGPRPFKFQDAWLTHKGCLEIVDAAWKNWNGCSLIDKLKMAKSELKAWNFDVFGNIDSHMLLLENEIQKWDLSANDRDLEPEEIEQRSMAQPEL